MKVLILAAGQSKRMAPLGDKNFISVAGKPLLVWQVEQLHRAGFRACAVVGGRHNLPELRAVAKTMKTPFTVLEQRDLSEGMAGAVLAGERFVGGDDVLVVSANDIVDDSIFAVLKKGLRDMKADGFLVAKRVDAYFPGGYLMVKGASKKAAERGTASGVGVITGIVEKPGAGNEPSDLVNIVFHVHRRAKDFFAQLKRARSARDDRYEVACGAMFSSGKRYIALPYDGFWQPVKYPWHLLDVWHVAVRACVGGRSAAERPIISKKAQVAKSAIVRGRVIIEAGARVFDHAVIQGPAYIGRGAIVANNALVRDSHIGDRSVVGFGTEIARSFLMNDVWTHTNYIGDSIVGSDSSFGSGTVVANLRLDEKPITVAVGDDGVGGGRAASERVDSGRTKLGAIIGEHVRVGVNTSIMPGVKIGNNCFVGAGIVVARDVPDGHFVHGTWELQMKKNTVALSPSARAEMMRRITG